MEDDDKRTICGTPVTIDTIAEAVGRHFRTQSHSVESFSAVEIGAGKGWSSVMARVRIHWKYGQSAITLPRYLLVKIPSRRQAERMVEKKDDKVFGDVLADSLETNAAKLHRIECVFYEQIATREDFPMRTVEVYGVETIGLNSPGFIIMQDLYGKVGHAPFLVGGLTLAQSLDVH